MNEHALQVKDSKIIYSNQGYISYKYRDIYFRIAKLTYELFENESYHYIFEPFYDIIDAFPSLDIPGLDLTLREKTYYRTNITPVFVSERVTPKNRVNLIEELKSYNIDYYQPFLLLLDSKNVYGGDQLSVKSDSFYSDIMNQINDTNDIYKTIAYTLRMLASRSEFYIGDVLVDKTSRTILIKNYLHLYEKVSRYYDDKSKNSRGRKKKTVSYVVLKEIQKQYSNGLITIDEAVKRSGLGSRRTYYRRVGELKERNSRS